MVVVSSPCGKKQSQLTTEVKLMCPSILKPNQPHGLMQSPAMAAPRLRTEHVILLISFLCCIILSHGRVIPREVRAVNSSLNGVTVSDCSSPTTSEAQNSSPGKGKIVSSIGDADSGWQAEDHYISVVPGKKWKGLGKVAEWVLHTCVVLLAVFVVFYAVSCICACCIGLDLLAEIWRSLGGCGALRALLSYFVSAEKAVVEGEAGSSPLLAEPAQ